MLFALSCTVMGVFEIVAALLVLSAAFSYLNYRYLHMPATIGLMAVALVFSLALLAGGKFYPGLEDHVRDSLARAPLDRTLLHGMLGFLLFAGALNLNLDDLAKHKTTIVTLATAGVLLSTAIIGALAWGAFRLLGLDIRPIDCLLLGALLSPTDPLAVLSILKSLAAPKGLETTIAGESLFNDGVGVTVYLGLWQIAAGEHEFGAASFALLFLREAVGGVAFGLLVGWFAYRVFKSVDQYQVEVLISLAVAAGGYAAAEALGLSAPLAIVTAGLFIGNRGRSLAMSEVTRQRLDEFWELLDEILNSILFLLIGLESIILTFSGRQLLAGLLMIPAALAARFVSVGVPLLGLSLRRRFPRGTVLLLTWGGLRGGISVAMALALHRHLTAASESARDLILTATYLIVVFSVLVQGLTVSNLVGRLFGREVEDRVRTEAAGAYKADASDVGAPRGANHG